MVVKEPQRETSQASWMKCKVVLGFLYIVELQRGQENRRSLVSLPWANNKA
jgi:hypothetical protein